MFPITDEVKKSFWSRVRILGPDDCWLWTKACQDYGYGAVGYNKKIYGTHVVAFYFTHEIWPTGIIIRHTCDNPPCCNPAHLIEGSHQDNIDDMISRDRQKNHQGHGSNWSGLQNPNSILSWDEIQRIRYLACFMNQADIYNLPEFRGKVSQSLISRIVNYKTRKGG